MRNLLRLLGRRPAKINHSLKTHIRSLRHSESHMYSWTPRLCRITWRRHWPCRSSATSSSSRARFHCASSLDPYCLTAHVLFPQSPVMQLARMPGGQSDTRAAKRRTELLAAIDTLSSHMQTTFTALSTALARRKVGDGSMGSAHIAFVLGPSVGAARARIVYAVDGLEVKVWGERDDLPGPSARPLAEKKDQIGEDVSDDDDESEEEESDEVSEEDEEESEGEFEDAEASDEDVSEPPASRSPSPSPTPPTSHSHASSPTRDLAENIAPVPAPRRANTYPPTPAPAPTQTYAEEQQALRTAERLLSRTLSNACADDSGGMSSELGTYKSFPPASPQLTHRAPPAPTQTHVLLRAPRRFAHPAWIPRQNLTRSLEGMLQAFLADACARDGAQPGKKGPSRGVKTEGVWVGRRSSSVVESVRLDGDGDGEDIDEEDEMIWWVWDGKIVGFADW